MYMRTKLSKYVCKKYFWLITGVMGHDFNWVIWKEQKQKSFGLHCPKAEFYDWTGIHTSCCYSMKIRQDLNENK